MFLGEIPSFGFRAFSAPTAVGRRAGGAHENVLQLVDVYDQSTKLMLVIELATGGDLLAWARVRRGDPGTPTGREPGRRRNSPSRQEHEGTATFLGPAQATSGENPFTERHAASACFQVLTAVAFLHENRVAHRDIKPDNVLVRDRRSFVLKVCDFGCSKILPPSHLKLIDDDADRAILMESFVGTKVYAAPEILRHEPYDLLVDEHARPRRNSPISAVAAAAADYPRRGARLRGLSTSRPRRRRDLASPRTIRVAAAAAPRSASA